jgi:hypothetical protein
MQYRSQKAKGLAFLDMIPGAKTVPHRIAQSEAEVAHAYASIVEVAGSDIFARPCPRTPRHGFVESRPVTGVEHARSVFREAQAADPDAEMILMPRVNALASAIFTPTTLAVGPGHDGATAGTGSYGFTLSPSILPVEAVMGAGVKTHPYVEIVYGSVGGGEINPYAVQIRDGEVPDGAGDQVAEDMKVLGVYHLPEDNSLKMPETEWEVFVKTLPAGTVVWHPGGTSTSHYAVHCKLNKVPCIFSHQPKVGEILEKTKVGQDLTDPDAMRVGLEIGATINLDFKEALQVALFGLHQYGTNSNPVGSKLQGVASSLMLRLSTAACLGELRHKRKYRKTEIIGNLARRQVFEKAWTDMFNSQKMMGVALKDFFERRWRSGYGGQAWGVCAMRNVELWDACLALHRNATVEHARDVIARLNNATNTAHNNGWLFNKFAPASYMDRAAQSEPGLIIRSGLAIYKAMSSPRPDATGWTKARKTRALTEIRKRLDIDSIADKRSGNSKHGGGKAPHIAESKGTPMTSLGEIVEVQAYKINQTNIHLQWKTNKQDSTGYNYFSGNVQYASELQGIGTNPSFSGSGKEYVKLPCKSGNMTEMDNGSMLLHVHLWQVCNQMQVDVNS